MHRWLVLTIAAVPLIFTSLRPAPPPFIWWTTDGLDKVRPFGKPPDNPKHSVEIAAARNEFEPFQVVFRADSENVEGMDLDVSDLKGSDGALVSKENISVYFEKFLDLPQPSSIEGAAGEWPDPLIPRVDRYVRERRNAFPFDLSSRRSQPIWIDVYVPPATPAGTYHGTVTVWIKEKRDATIPITLKIWNFTIPSTSSFPTSFGFNGISAVRQHLGKYTNDADVRNFTFIYRKAALWHRLSLHGGSMTPPPFQIVNDKIEIDWKYFDEEVGPFLDGTAFASNEPLYGAKATATDLRTNHNLENDKQRILYWRAFADHFREKGWISRLYNYLWDEPKPDSYDKLLELGRLVHSADNDLKNLVTASLHAQWTNTIDIWSPLVNCFAFKNGFSNFCEPMMARSQYQDETKKGTKLWWYQSCASHGCSIVGGEYFRGWPGYIIDNVGVANRIMPWLAWKYSIDGELYYNIDEAYTHKADAWTDVYLFGGNGDGTLVYPGRARTIGGKVDIPIESIRLKLIREGLEDYEYLTLLSKSQGFDAASRFVDGIVTNAYTYDRDPAHLYEVRRQIGEELNKRETVN